jgi:hypothetical protein
MLCLERSAELKEMYTDVDFDIGAIRRGSPKELPELSGIAVLAGHDSVGTRRG